MDQSRPDEELLRQLAAGDPNAMDLLMERFETPVLNAIYWSIGDRHRAEELAQEVFVAVYRQRRRYQPRAKFTTWLFRIVRNRCLNELRDRATANRHVVPMPEGIEELPEKRSVSPDAQAERADTQRAGFVARNTTHGFRPFENRRVFLRRDRRDSRDHPLGVRIIDPPGAPEPAHQTASARGNFEVSASFLRNACL